MNLARHTISATAPILIFDTRIDADCRIFTTCTPAGFAVYSTWPLKLLRKQGAVVLQSYVSPEMNNDIHRDYWWDTRCRRAYAHIVPDIPRGRRP